MVELMTKSEKKKIDLLGRKKVVNDLVQITEVLADKKANVCYALNGGWGVGKSFVLKMYEEEIVLYQSSASPAGKYLLFHYNCWQYDFYEEPLVALAAMMQDTIDEKVNLFTEDTRNTVKEILKIVGEGLYKKASEYIEDKTGINIGELTDITKQAREEAKKKTLTDKSFDSYHGFKKTLSKLKEQVQSLAKDQTILIVVDELDRCLPEYAIKVLERLHHVFIDIPNVQMILSIDKQQLSHTVKQIYGEATSADKYLAKFIAFDVKLNEGTINKQFGSKFEFYVRKFEPGDSAKSRKFNDNLLRTFFDGIDIRNCIAIIERCDLLHNLLNSYETISMSDYMYIEVFLTVLKHFQIDMTTVSSALNEENPFGLDELEKSGRVAYSPKGICALSSKIKEPWAPQYCVKNGGETTIDPCDLLGLILGIYRYLAGYTSDLWKDSKYDKSRLTTYAKEYWQLLETIS